ncbi:MAG: ABC transporter permease [Termitinemataceae bacterium]|nr:MAG: ABC transporter permease [Termitinemataceae bacterium]
MKHKHTWIIFVASRFIKSGKKSSTSTILSVLGIAVGVLALTVIIAVMNGFQLGFIESILEISSYHVRVNSFPLNNNDLLYKVCNLTDIKSAVPFKEVKGIVRTRHPVRLSEQTACVVRGVPPDTLLLDSAMADKIDFEEGIFDLTEKHSIVIGAEAADMLKIDVGDEVNFWTISNNSPLGGLEQDEDPVFVVTGIFRSGYYEYDLSWAFIDITEAFMLDSTSIEDAEIFCTLGIKINNRWKIDKALENINALLLAELGEDYITKNNINVTTWRDYNKSFFSALRTEKLLMFVLVGLIFIVVALNIFQSQRRTVLERSEEIGLLRSVGATSLSVRCVFMFDGIIIGAIGASFGMAVALMISTHIKEFFSAIEYIVNSILLLITAITGSGAEMYSIFSPKIFYIKDIPSRIIPHEIILIFLFGFLSAVAASWFASKKATAIKPTQILRYE